MRALSLALLAAACAVSCNRGGVPSPQSPPRETFGPRQDPLPTEHAISNEAPVWAACADSFSPTGDPKHDLERLTRYCGAPLGMHAVSPVREASQREDDPVDRYTWSATAGKCYRVYAVGGDGVKDLDLLVRDADGHDVAEDAANDAFPIAPPKGPLCSERGGVFVLEVSVHAGAGPYVVQIWGS
jgi:hypothetical protein